MGLDIDAYHSRASRVDADTTAGDAGKTEDDGIMLLKRRDGLREARRLSGGNPELRSREQDEKAERNSKREYSAHNQSSTNQLCVAVLGAASRGNFRNAVIR